MASASGVRAGKAYVELSLDNKIQAGLQSARAKLQAFGKSLAFVGVGLSGAGGAVVAPFLAAAKLFASMGSAVYDVTQRTGVSAEAFSELGYIVEQAGGSVAGLEKGFRKLGQVTTDAAAGSKSAQAALAAVGLTAADLAGLKPEDQLEAIADGLATIPDAATRSAAALDIFGRTGAEIAPILARGSAGLRAARREANALGLTLSGADAESADRLGDAFSLLAIQGKYLFAQLGAAVAPILSEVAENASRVVAAIIKFAKENRGLLATVFTVAAGVVALGSAFLAAGATLAVAGLALGGIATVIGAIGSIATVAVAAFTAMLSPLGLTVIGLAAVLASLIAIAEYTTGAFSAALDFIMTRFGVLRETVGQTFDGIRDALLASDLQLAAKILWTGLELAFVQGAVAVSEVFFGMIAGIQSAWAKMADSLGQSWTVFAAKVQTSVLILRQAVADSMRLLKYTGSIGSVVASSLLSGTEQEQTDKAIGEINAAARAAVAAGEGDLGADLAAIEATRAARVAAAGIGVSVLAAQLDALTNEAAKAREERDAIKVSEEKAKSATPPPADTAGAIKQGIAGTFEGSRIEGLFGGGFFTRISDATRKIAGDVSAIRRDIDEMEGAAFGD